MHNETGRIVEDKYECKRQLHTTGRVPGSSLTDFVSAHFYNSLEHASGQVYYEGELLLTQRPECRRKTEDRR